MFKIVKIIGIVGIGLIVFTIGILVFYWFQLRPTQIKHDCSWVKIIQKAQPGRPALTENDLWKKGLLNTCPTSQPLPTEASKTNTQESYKQKFENSRVQILNIKSASCKSDNEKILKEYGIEQKGTPEKIYWREATEKEYKFCLHDKGL